MLIPRRWRVYDRFQVEAEDKLQAEFWKLQRKRRDAVFAPGLDGELFWLHMKKLGLIVILVWLVWEIGCEIIIIKETIEASEMQALEAMDREDEAKGRRRRSSSPPPRSRRSKRCPSPGIDAGIDRVLGARCTNVGATLPVDVEGYQRCEAFLKKYGFKLLRKYQMSPVVPSVKPRGT